MPTLEISLSITKSDSPDPVTAGATLTYTLQVSNRGPSPASAVTVIDTLPAGVTFISASGTGWNFSRTGGTVTCTRPGLEVGTAPAITITVRAPTAAGTITNTASVTATELDLLLADNATTATTGVVPAATPAPTPTPTPAPALTPTPTPRTPTATPTPAPTQMPAELSQILGRAAGIASVKYDMVVTVPGVGQLTYKVWQKKNKMRMEMTTAGIAMVYLVDSDAKTAYMYIPAQNTATKVDMSKVPQPAPTSIEQYKPVVIGSETLDGKDCLVVEYEAGGMKTKAWIWKEKGFPIRMEATAPQGTSAMEFKNIEFVDIPDSMFELPAGVMPGG